MNATNLVKESLDVARLVLTGRFTAELEEVLKKMSKVRNMLKMEVSECRDGVKVSVVVPTRNERRYLPRLLSSLRRSPCKNVEIICVDYMSTDGTPDIAKLYGAKVIRVTRKGVGYANHVGVLNANGEIIIKTDADAIFPPNLIPSAVKALTSTANIVLYHVSHIYYDAGIVENLLAHLYDKYWRRPEQTTGHFIAFRREIYKEVQFDINADVGEDDFKFGSDVYKRFGSHAIYYDRNTYVLVSARRIRKVGLLRYVLGIQR